MTTIFSKMGKLMPYVVAQNNRISWASPGSWPPNWLHGTPITENPR